MFCCCLNMDLEVPKIDQLGKFTPGQNCKSKMNDIYFPKNPSNFFSYFEYI